MSISSGDKVREARQRWFGHVLRKDAGYIIGIGMLTMELPGKRKREKFMDAAREDMATVDVRGEDAEERADWRRRIRCGDP